MKQVIIDFGTLKFLGLSFSPKIFGYGLMLVLGFLLAIYLARWRARRCGEDPDALSRCGILALVAGVLGARIAYVIENWRDFSHPDSTILDVLNVTSGGLIYYGGLLLGTLAVLVYLWAKRMPVRRYLDILAVSIMVGLAFGRAGCLLNGCCFGSRCDQHWPLAQTFPMYCTPLVKLGNGGNPFSRATDSPTPVYAHQIDPRAAELSPDPRLLDEEGRLIPPQKLKGQQIAIAEASRSLPVKPSQAIGIVNALLLAVLLGFFFRLRTREGQVFALLLLMYPVTRFLEEAIRAQPIVLAGMTHNQITSILMFVAGVVMWVLLRRARASAGPAWAEREAAKAAASARQNHRKA